MRSRVAISILAATVLAGCNDFLLGGNENPYSGGSIPYGKGPVVAAGYVVDGASSRSVIRDASVTILDGSGRTQTNRTDRRGIFYLDGVRPGLAVVSVEAGADYLPFNASVELRAGDRVSCSIALYSRERAPELSYGGAPGELAIELPAALEPGADASPSVPEAFGQYQELFSYICVSRAAAVRQSGDLLSVSPGRGVLHVFFEGAHYARDFEVER